MSLGKEKNTIGNSLKKLAGVNDVSAARANMLSLNRNMIQLYLSIKRFNGENKETNLQNFLNEFRYALHLIMNTKEIVNFIYSLLNKRNAADLNREIRLYLHTYFNCEFTMILGVTFPNSIGEKTMISG